VGFVVDKVAMGQVFSEYFGFPCHRKFSILTITRGRYNRIVNGRGAEWTQFGLHPPLCAKKKKGQFVPKIIIYQESSAVAEFN
jgi:hypothetical protein